MAQLAIDKEKEFLHEWETPLGKNESYQTIVKEFIKATNQYKGTIVYEEAEIISITVSSCPREIDSFLLTKDEKNFSYILAGKCLYVIPKMRIHKKPLTAKALLNSGLVGLWKNRTDIESSESFASYLRNLIQKREQN